MVEISNNARRYSELLLADRHRPAWHFAIPYGCGMPGDPNGAFFADGQYHLMYLYRNHHNAAYHWGHLVSADLLHWRQLPDALTGMDGDEGCFSGGAFLDDDGTAYLTFWKFAAKDGSDRSGIGMARSASPYVVWERMKPIAVDSTVWGIRDIESDGKTVHTGCADPSNIWKMNGCYYMQLGNLCVLDKYGRSPDSPAEYRGDWTELYRSDDLINWEYLHRFYSRMTGFPGAPDDSEDDMCPSFLPLYDKPEGGEFTGKYLQLFISHNKGCQYYVGRLENERFIPESHGRMSWVDNTFFAPEALVDDRNRHIMWAWLTDNRGDEFNRFGWTGVYSFPRLLWLEGEELSMAPVPELDSLMCNERDPGLAPGGLYIPETPDAFRLKAVFDLRGGGRAGLRICASPDGSEYTDIYFDSKTGELVFDARKSGPEGRRVREAAPFTVSEDGMLNLDIFFDRSVAEVYADNRRAVCRRVYNSPGSEGISLIAEGSATLTGCKVWSMRGTNPC